jgi:hypothetical protein
MAYGARPGGHTDQSGRTHDSERMRPALRPDRAVRARGVSRRLGLEAAGGEEPERGRARAG